MVEGKWTLRITSPLRTRRDNRREMKYKELAEEFIGKEGEGRFHPNQNSRNCALCKEVRDFAEFLEGKTIRGKKMRDFIRNK